MLQIALYQPEIPPNTGNIIRLGANTGSQLHLIKPLAFELDDKRLRRAGLDYHEWANLIIHDSFEDFLAQINPQRLFACSTHATTHYTDIQYNAEDVLLFGPETRGLPKDYLASLDDEHKIRIPMVKDSRSLNLSNAVAIILYEAWRQLGFAGYDR